MHFDNSVVHQELLQLKFSLFYLFGDGLTSLFCTACETHIKCLALFDFSWRNWFCKSQLMSMVAIGLQKPYAKTKVGMSCTCMVIIDSGDGCLYKWFKMPGIHFQGQNTEQ